MHQYRLEAHAIARAIPGRLAWLQIAIAPGPAPRLLVVVRLSSQGLDLPARPRCSLQADAAAE
jgi:hypothetical protein